MPYLLVCQNLEKIGKSKLFKFSGGINANAVFYNGNSSREPFTYFLSGNLNISVSGVYNIPLSFSYSNQGFEYANPFSFNRLSLHPSYKWVATHIGDVSMNFSPYTLSGHQFTGFGFDLTPKGPFKISAMYGRLLKATEYDPENPNALVAYKRNGFGIKTSYEFEKFDVELIFFKAKDDSNSLKNPIPSELQLTAKDNAVVSVKTNFSIIEKAQISIEYALSGVTEDITAIGDNNKKGILSFLLNENNTTNYYKAFKTSLTYSAGNGTIGAGYERIDPNYKTFGAYFFNNDLENITVNANQTIFNNKLNIGVNAGFQKDNLDNAKSSQMNRMVGSVNANYNASEKLAINASYSNFQSFTNIRDQFEYINQVTEYDNIDTLNYRQISQNANLGVNYEIQKNKIKQQSVNLNLLYQDSKNFQEEKELEEQSNDFYNASASYSLGFLEKDLRFSLGSNVSYNTAAENKNITWGPTFTASKNYLNKKLRTRFSTSYNQTSINGNQQNSNLNFRLGANYQYLKSHRFGLNAMSLHRFSSDKKSNNDFTVTFNYNYTFTPFKSRKRESSPLKKQNNNLIDFRYRETTYRGTIEEVNQQLENVINAKRSNYYTPIEKQREVDELFIITKKQTKPRIYKKSALTLLKSLYEKNKFENTYKELLHEVILRTKNDGDYFERRETVKALTGKTRQKKALKIHEIIQKEIAPLLDRDAINNPDEKFKNFIKLNLDKVFKMYQEEKREKIILYLEERILNYYGKE